MARECAICGKTGMLVYRRKKLRGKYNPTAKVKQKPNLQKVKVIEGIQRKQFKPYEGKSVLMCSKCRRTMHKPKK
jgi:ribosomal protein L28